MCCPTRFELGNDATNIIHGKDIMWRSSNEYGARTLKMTLEINQEKGENGTPRFKVEVWCWIWRRKYGCKKMENKKFGQNITDSSSEESKARINGTYYERRRRKWRRRIRYSRIACAFMTIPGYNFVFTIAAFRYYSGHSCFKMVFCHATTRKARKILVLPAWNTFVEARKNRSVLQNITLVVYKRLLSYDVTEIKTGLLLQHSKSTDVNRRRYIIWTTGESVVKKAHIKKCEF
jgi:hypothetical protein